jgi:hypothetical protein
MSGRPIGVEWTLLRDGQPVVTDIANDGPGALEAALRAAKFLESRQQEQSRVVE